MKLSEELKWRGFVNQTTLDDLSKLDAEKWIFYCGYDASADSLTIGNLAVLMLNKAFVRHGHKPILLAGGATSLIGDPGGKDIERPLQDEAEISNNVRKVKEQIEQLLGKEVHMVNNLDWYKEMNVMHFLRDVGKHFSMTPLVQRDYIAKRMGEGGNGISYTEFSYTLLQGYDYLHLYQKYGVELQLAGSDQWGNCISGVDLVRKVENKEVHALTMPLILNKSTGKKFGKSEEGAVWLDAEKTSAYKFYQFWLNVDDAGVEDYLKIFTELDKESIEKIMNSFQDNKASRVAQKKLAYEVSSLVHGKKHTDAVVRATNVLFGEGDFLSLTKEEKFVLRKELPVVAAQEGLASTIVKSGLASSNSEANRFISSGGIYINGEKAEINSEFAKGDNLLRRGKNTFAIVEAH